MNQNKASQSKARQNSINQNKLDYITGIKGIASILVVLCHLSCVFFPGFSSESCVSNSFERFWVNSPFNILTIGSFPVQCFFVISGFLNARKVYTNREWIVLDPFRTYRKYVRTIVPGILFMVCLILCDGLFHLKALSVCPGLSYVSGFDQFHVSLRSVLKDIMLNSFIDASCYVAPYWTIRFEFFGALLVSYLAYYCAGSRSAKKIYLFFLVLAFYYSYFFVSFLLGAFLFECIYREDTDQSIAGRLIRFIHTRKPLRVCTVIIAVYLATANQILSGIWHPLQYLPFFNAHPPVYKALGISVLLFYTMKSESVQKIFANPVFMFIGKLSPYIYGFHWPLILSLGCRVFLAAYNRMRYRWVTVLVSASVIIVSVALSWLYSKVSDWVPHWRIWQLLRQRVCTLLTRCH